MTTKNNAVAYEPEPPHPPDFRFFRLGLNKAQPVACTGCRAVSPNYKVFSTETALSLVCETCGDTTVVIINQIVEMP